MKNKTLIIAGAIVIIFLVIVIAATTIILEVIDNNDDKYYVPTTTTSTQPTQVSGSTLDNINNMMTNFGIAAPTDKYDTPEAEIAAKSALIDAKAAEVATTYGIDLSSATTTDQKYAQVNSNLIQQIDYILEVTDARGTDSYQDEAAEDGYDARESALDDIKERHSTLAEKIQGLKDAKQLQKEVEEFNKSVVQRYQ